MTEPKPGEAEALPTIERDGKRWTLLRATGSPEDLLPTQEDADIEDITALLAALPTIKRLEVFGDVFRPAELEDQLLCTNQQLELVTAERDQLRAELESRRSPEATLDLLRSLRGFDTPCDRCHGAGCYSYSSTATWLGGMGGQAFTVDVCDACWGTGDAHRRGVDLRAKKAELAELRASLASVTKERDELRVRALQFTTIDYDDPGTLPTTDDWCLLEYDDGERRGVIRGRWDPDHSPDPRWYDDETDGCDDKLEWPIGHIKRWAPWPEPSMTNDPKTRGTK